MIRHYISGALVLAAVLVVGNDLRGGLAAAVMILTAMLIQGVRT